MPSPTDEAYQANYALVRKLLCSNNLIQQCSDRHLNALVGNPPVVQALIHALITGTGCLRLFSPSRFINADVDPNLKLCLHAPHPSDISTFSDSEGILYKIHYRYRDLDGHEFTEVQTLDAKTGKLYIATYQGNPGTNAEETGNAVGKPLLRPAKTQLELDLNGNFTIAVLKLRPLVNPSIISLQCALTHLLTLRSKVIQDSGFLQTFILSGAPPGEYQEDDKGNITGFTPDPKGIQSGSGLVNFIGGIPEVTKDNTYKLTNPSVTVIPPVPMATFETAQQLIKSDIYHSFNQGHLLASSDGSLAAVSRAQLANDHAAAVKSHAGRVQSFLGSVLSAALGILLTLHGQSPLLAKTHIVKVQLKLNLGSMTPEQEKSILDQFNSKVVSRETTLSRLKFDDPKAELARLEAEEAVEEARQTRINDPMEHYIATSPKKKESNDGQTTKTEQRKSNQAGNSKIQ